MAKGERTDTERLDWLEERMRFTENREFDMVRIYLAKGCSLRKVIDENLDATIYAEHDEAIDAAQAGGEEERG